MTIKEYAKSKNITPQAVSKYIPTCPGLMEHTEKRGKSRFLDDEAIRMLNEHFKDPAPAVIDMSREIELQKQVIALQEQVIALQGQISEMTPKIAQAEIKAALIDANERENTELKAEIERLKSRGLLERILNR